MAKGSITKRKNPLSKHSREARRATSPSIDTDKSLKEARAPAESINHRPSILAIHQGAGVSKKQKQGRQLSSRAKRRAERGQDKAIAIIERTETKVEKSKNSSRNIQTRAKKWDDINKAVPLTRNAFQSLGGDDDWEDQDSESDQEEGAVKQAKTAALQTLVVEDVPLTTDMDDDDEIL